FLMTNIMPQAPHNNQRGWERLEHYCRELAKEGKELHIVAGPHGRGGQGSLGFSNKIGSGKATVTVPAHTWKVILVLPKKGATPTKHTRTIAAIFPNTQGVDFFWPAHRVSINDVEELTGLNFFPDIPEAVAAVLKANVDDTDVDVQ